MAGSALEKHVRHLITTRVERTHFSTWNLGCSIFLWIAAICVTWVWYDRGPRLDSIKIFEELVPPVISSAEALYFARSGRLSDEVYFLDTNGAVSIELGKYTLKSEEKQVKYLAMELQDTRSTKEKQYDGFEYEPKGKILIRMPMDEGKTTSIPTLEFSHLKTKSLKALLNHANPIASKACLEKQDYINALKKEKLTLHHLFQAGIPCGFFRPLYDVEREALAKSINWKTLSHRLIPVVLESTDLKPTPWQHFAHNILRPVSLLALTGSIVFYMLYQSTTRLYRAIVEVLFPSLPLPQARFATEVRTIANSVKLSIPLPSFRNGEDYLKVIGDLRDVMPDIGHGGIRGNFFIFAAKHVTSEWPVAVAIPLANSIVDIQLQDESSLVFYIDQGDQGESRAIVMEGLSCTTPIRDTIHRTDTAEATELSTFTVENIANAATLADRFRNVAERQIPNFSQRSEAMDAARAALARARNRSYDHSVVAANEVIAKIASKSYPLSATDDTLRIECIHCQNVEFSIPKNEKCPKCKARLEPNSCAICLEPFEVDAIVAKWPECNHVFHRDCLIDNALRSARCALCRKQVPAAPPPRFTLPFRISISQLDDFFAFLQQLASEQHHEHTL